MIDRKTYSDAAYVAKFQASEPELQKWDMANQISNDTDDVQQPDTVKSDEFSLIHDEQAHYLGDLALAKHRSAQSSL